MANPVKQMALWAVKLVESAVAGNWSSIVTIAALAMGGYLGYTLLQRFRSGNDPSLRLSTESAGGSMSVLLSGVHVTATLAGGIALLTWPAAVKAPGLGILLAGAVVVHYALEKREVSMS